MIQILRLICFGIAAFMLVQVSRLVARKDPLAQLNLPPISSSAAPAPSPEKKSTNSVAVSSPAKTDAAPSPAEQARVERIVQSEILGPVIRPLPMALLGIAGPDVFLRAPNGQTGLLREGQELGGVKLLRIGTNRVLVEEAGKKKELMIFSGFGSQTLLQQGKETP